MAQHVGEVVVVEVVFHVVPHLAAAGAAQHITFSEVGSHHATSFCVFAMSACTC
jgi:hypothetical protein